MTLIASRKKKTMTDMKRTPEPELMDSTAQTKAYAEADFSDSNEMFVSQFIHHFPQPGQSGTMADLGCGPADISIRLAKALPGWQVLGLDAGENMLRQAEAAVTSAGMHDRVSLQHSYLPDDRLQRGSFDAVVSNSLLHHLPEPATLWNTVNDIARNGAAIAVMDLHRPDSESEAQSLVDTYAEGAPDILREDFYNSLLAAYTVAEIREQLDRCGLAGLEITRPSDRHWMVIGRT